MLMSVRAPVGDVNIATSDCVIGRGVAAIRAGSRTDPWFLYFVLIHSKLTLESRATGSTFASINKATLVDLDIPFPEKEEQVAIGIILYWLFTKIEQEESIISTAQNLKRTTMRALFTRGMRREAQKETEIGPMPESWGVISLGDVCLLSTGTTPSTKRADYYRGDVPFIKTAEIVNNRIKTASTFLSQQAVTEYNLRLYPAGTVLMAMYGQGKTRGQVALLELPATTTQNAAAIQTNAALNPSFLWHFLLSKYNQLRCMGSLGHLSHLNLGYLRELLIPMPPTLEEQLEIVIILDAIDRKIDLHRRKRAVLDELFKALLHKLMTGEIRVADLDLSALEPKKATEVAA